MPIHQENGEGMRRRYFLASAGALGATAVAPTLGQQKPLAANISMGGSVRGGRTLRTAALDVLS
jgi:hypothetical protein